MTILQGSCLGSCSMLLDSRVLVLRGSRRGSCWSSCLPLLQWLPLCKLGCRAVVFAIGQNSVRCLALAACSWGSLGLEEIQHGLGRPAYQKNPHERSICERETDTCTMGRKLTVEQWEWLGFEEHCLWRPAHQKISRQMLVYHAREYIQNVMYMA